MVIVRQSNNTDDDGSGGSEDGGLSFRRIASSHGMRLQFNSAEENGGTMTFKWAWYSFAITWP